MADVSKLFDLDDPDGSDPFATTDEEDIDSNEVNFVHEYDDKDFDSDEDGDYADSDVAPTENSAEDHKDGISAPSSPAFEALEHSLLNNPHYSLFLDRGIDKALPPMKSERTERSPMMLSLIEPFTNLEPPTPAESAYALSKSPRHQRPPYSSTPGSHNKIRFADPLAAPSHAPARKSGAPWTLWIFPLLFFGLVALFLSRIPQSPIPATQEFYVRFPAALHKARLLNLQPYHMRQRATTLTRLRGALAGNLGLALPEHTSHPPEPNPKSRLASHEDTGNEDEETNMVDNVNKSLDENEYDIFKLMELHASTSDTAASSIVILYRTLASSAVGIVAHSSDVVTELGKLAAWDKDYPWHAKFWEILDAVGIRETQNGGWKWGRGVLDTAFDGREEAKRVRVWKDSMQEMKGIVEGLLENARGVEAEVEVLGRVSLTLARRLDAEWKRVVNGEDTGKGEGLKAVKEWIESKIGASDLKKQDTLKILMTVGRALQGTIDTNGLKGIVRDLESCVEVLDRQLTWRGRWGRGIGDYLKLVDKGTEKIVGLVMLYREQGG